VLNVRKKLNFIRLSIILCQIFSITTKDEQDPIAKISRNNDYYIEIFDNENDALGLIGLIIIIHLHCHSTKDE